MPKEKTIKGGSGEKYLLNRQHKFASIMLDL